MLTTQSPAGLLITAARSGAGKTTLALGMMRAFRRRGVAVCGMKCGPDYIDSAFHAVATARSGTNLDSWAMSREVLEDLAFRASCGCEIALAEGALGLFDGVPAGEGEGRSGSSADVAAALGWPVLLVLDVRGQSQSAAAIALGLASFDPRITVTAVVLNRIASERHERWIRSGFERTGLPVVGAVPDVKELELPERHLGLVQSCEIAELSSRLDRIAELVETYVDLDAVRSLVRPTVRGAARMRREILPPAQRIAVAHDLAFSFIYPHLIDAWRDAGSEVRFFSPLADEGPPMDCEVCWLPGGYPELHAERLAHARRFREAMLRFSQTKPVHGECGGYMVLGKALIDANGVSHPMLGLLDVETSFATRRRVLGYRQAELLCDGVLGQRGARWRGHEFHYATLTSQGSDEPFARLEGPSCAPVAAGHRRGSVTGSFFHAICPVL